jgi:hypothetical protein
MVGDRSEMTTVHRVARIARLQAAKVASVLYGVFGVVMVRSLSSLTCSGLRTPCPYGFPFCSFRSMPSPVSS